MMDSRTKRSSPWLGNTLRISLGVLAIYLLVHSGALNPHLLKQAMVRHPLWYVEAFLLYSVILEGIAYLRWYWLLRAAKVNVSAGFVLRLHLIGLFFSGILPGGTGGDFVKGFYLLRGRDKAEGAAAIGTMVVDRVAGTLGLIWLGTLTNIWNYKLWEDSPILGAQAFVFLGASVATLILIFTYLAPWKSRKSIDSLTMESNPEHGFWKGLWISLAAFRSSPWVFMGVILLAMCVHLSIVGVYALCAEMLEVDLPFKIHAYVVPALTLINGIPISPAGLGFGEQGGKVLYNVIDKARGMATHGHTEIPALFHSIVLLTSLLCAPAYFFMKVKKENETNVDVKPGVGE